MDQNIKTGSKTKYSYIKRIEELLNDDQRDVLAHIYEPRVVATPLSDSRRDVCVMPDGEIRSYGRLYAKSYPSDSGQAAYLSSRDAGASWTLHYSHGRMNSCTYFEEKKIYLTVVDTYNDNYGLGQGLWVLRSSVGPDDPSPEFIRISDERYIDSFLPQKSEFSDRIWFTTHKTDRSNIWESVSYTYFFYSDDYGSTWTGVELPPIQGHDVAFPHKGVRWSKGSGGEANAIELSDGRMMMIIRTPKDCFYLSYSSDGGESWSYPEPSQFYGTNTTAYLLKLSDGRVLCFWNNTKPLPEADHEATRPPVSDYVKKGISEDVFTNRDVAHVAISEDNGKTFIGCRELFLNPVRNNTDFRYVGGAETSADKSVHQFQAFELPHNKILVSVGQNAVCRRLMVFDLDWLYETCVNEDFVKNSLSKITTHTYVKSVSDSQVARVGNGHCSWNRAPAAYLVPDPFGGYGEVLSISKLHDERMFNDIGGATWNFPASRKARVSIELYIAGGRAKCILTDRWYNPCDAYAAYQSPLVFELERKDTGDNFAAVDVEYDLNTERTVVLVNGQIHAEFKISMPHPAALSYLVLQCDSEDGSKGYYVRSLKKEDVEKSCR